MSRFAILLGGTVTVTDRLKSQVTGARVIAADSGIVHAGPLGLEPELWIGDFDSSSLDLQKTHAAIPRETFPTEKNATDGDLAISEAFRRGATEIIMVGGFGGQIDHAQAHVAMLLAMARREILCMITSGHEEAYPLAFEVILIDVKPGTRISIVPMSDIKGLTWLGVKWPLKHKSVPFGSTLTLSNVTTGPVTIQCDIGSGLVILYP